MKLVAKIKKNQSALNKAIRLGNKYITLGDKYEQIEDAISYLKELELDGESTQLILEGIGMDEQMHSQLNVKFKNI